jgi:membrane-associated protein
MELFVCGLLIQKLDLLMKLSKSLLLLFGAIYSLLFVLSVLFIVPRHLSSGLGTYLLALLTDTTLEGRPARSFFSPLIWILIPLASLGLCAMSWVTYGAAVRSSSSIKKLAELGGAILFAASLFPTILVVRELLAYHILGVDLPATLVFLTNLIRAMEKVTNPTLLLGRGSWVIPVVIFVETGLFFGFFLPGDSLLLTVGVLGSAGHLNLWLLIPSSILAAVAGDQLGYVIGRQSGEALAVRYRFVRDNVKRATEFYARHGGKAIVLARFVPVVRTFAPIVAGAARMAYLRFIISNIAGGVLWVLSVTLAGYFVGNQVPEVVDYLNPLIYLIILTSPLVWVSAWLSARTKKTTPDGRSL